MSDAPIVWRFAHFDLLLPAELYAITEARNSVFIVEQNCPYQDIDGVDTCCHHLWTVDDQQRVVAYLRIVPPGVKYAEPSIGRILTTPTVRRTGLGRKLVADGLARVRKLYGDTAVRIAAQRYLVEFYREFGFVETGNDFDEDGIPHSEMLRPKERE